MKLLLSYSTSRHSATCACLSTNYYRMWTHQQHHTVWTSITNMPLSCKCPYCSGIYCYKAGWAVRIQKIHLEVPIGNVEPPYYLNVFHIYSEAYRPVPYRHEESVEQNRSPSPTTVESIDVSAYCHHLHLPPLALVLNTHSQCLESLFGLQSTHTEDIQNLSFYLWNWWI